MLVSRSGLSGSEKYAVRNEIGSLFDYFAENYKQGFCIVRAIGQNVFIDTTDVDRATRTILLYYDANSF